jgi:hypothetical protein
MDGDSLGNTYRDDHIGKDAAVATLVLGRYADSTTVINCWFDLQQMVSRSHHTYRQVYMQAHALESVKALTLQRNDMNGYQDDRSKASPRDSVRERI